MKSLLPWVGDKRARKAWDTVFSRDVLGSVVLGGATGKFVEYVIAFLVLLILGPDPRPFWETVGYLISWSVAIPVGVWTFVYWHRVEDSVEDGVEDTVEEGVDAVDAMDAVSEET